MFQRPGAAGRAWQPERRNSGIIDWILRIISSPRLPRWWVGGGLRSPEQYQGPGGQCWIINHCSNFSHDLQQFSRGRGKNNYNLYTSRCKYRFMVSIYLLRPLHISLVASLSLSENIWPPSVRAPATDWLAHYFHSCSSIVNISLLAANSWHLIFQNITRKIPIASCLGSWNEKIVITVCSQDTFDDIYLRLTFGNVWHKKRFLLVNKFLILSELAI